MNLLYLLLCISTLVIPRSDDRTEDHIEINISTPKEIQLNEVLIASVYFENKGQQEAIVIDNSKMLISTLVTKNGEETKPPNRYIYSGQTDHRPITLQPNKKDSIKIFFNNLYPNEENIIKIYLEHFDQTHLLSSHVSADIAIIRGTDESCYNKVQDFRMRYESNSIKDNINPLQQLISNNSCNEIKVFFEAQFATCLMFEKDFETANQLISIGASSELLNEDDIEGYRINYGYQMSKVHKEKATEYLKAHFPERYLDIIERFPK